MNLRENILKTSDKIDELQQQNDSYQNEIENLQNLLYDETESGSKATTKVILLTKKLEEAEKQANQSIQ